MAFEFLKSAKQRGTLGIDVGTSSIKIVELEKKAGRFELTNYGILELQRSKSSAQQSESWQSVLKLPDQEIASGILELIKRGKFNSTDVVISIPSFSTFSTVI